MVQVADVEACGALLQVLLVLPVLLILPVLHVLPVLQVHGAGG
jgi:hypothetical protein